MKMIWIFLTVALSFAEKLDRAYLPPPEAHFSEDSSGGINIPVELPRNKISSIVDTPEIVIGIIRVGPNQVDNSFEDISTHKPKLIHKSNSLNIPTQTTSSFKQSSPFSKQEPTIPEFKYNDGISIENIGNHSRIPTLDEKNRVYLPSYSENNIDKIAFITIPSTIYNEKGKSDENKNIQPDTIINKEPSFLSPNDEQFSVISTTLSPNYSNGAITNITPHNSYSSTASQDMMRSPTKGILITNLMGYQRPERVQAQADRLAEILNYDQSLTPESYAYRYDTSNGIHGDEEGTAKNGVKAKGSYSYIGDDGNFYQVEYTADNNGFMPKGAHLPTAPPIPDAILKVIEQAARDKEAGVYDDGSYDENKYGYKKYQDVISVKASQIVNGADLPPENERDDENGDPFDDYVESNEQDGIEKQEMMQVIENDNINFSKTNVKYNNNLNIKNNSAPYKNHHNKLQSVIGISKSAGYEYFPPKSSFIDTNEIDMFSTRFLGLDNKKMNKNNTEIVTAKPFLTPYVSRKNLDSNNNDYDEPFINDDHDTDFEEQPLNTFEENYEMGIGPNNSNDHQLGNNSKSQGKTGEDPNDKHGMIESHKLIPSNKPGQQLQFGDIIHTDNHLIPTDDSGYIYHDANTPFVNLSPRLSYTTAAPVEFPAIIRTQDISRTSETVSPSFQPNSISEETQLLSDTFPTKLPIYSLPTRNISSMVLDSDSTSLHPDTLSKTDSLSTPKPLEISQPVPGGIRYMMYRLATINIEKFNGQTTTENIIISEDFTGAKQSQHFNPITGYYY